MAQTTSNPLVETVAKENILSIVTLLETHNFRVQTRPRTSRNAFRGIVCGTRIPKSDVYFIAIIIQMTCTPVLSLVVASITRYVDLSDNVMRFELNSDMAYEDLSFMIKGKWIAHKEYDGMMWSHTGISTTLDMWFAICFYM